MIVIVIARMTRNDHSNKLELSIHTHSGVDSAQWDMGIICTTYRTPDSLVDWYDNFTDMYDSAYLEKKDIIMIGNLNLDFLKPHDVPPKWYNILDKYYINQLINEPTSVKKQTTLL